MKVILLDEAKKWLEENCENQYTRMAVFGIMQSMPTVDYQETPNEPLTWSELAEMEGQPVYIVEMGVRRYWALVTHVGKDSADFVTVHDPDDYGDKGLYGKSWVVYRLPPEGEEEMKDDHMG